MNDVTLNSHFARWRWALLIPVAALYFFSLPHTVQNLDSGELATSAWNLTVPHPPGYPIHVWLHSLFVRLVPWGSVYHRAAFATALLMLSAIAVLIRMTRDWTGLAVVAAFATSPIVFLYAVLPDVFALHCALSAVVIMMAFEPPSSRRIWFAAAAFGLGAANHQSIVFLSPVLAYIVLEERRPFDRLGALAFGASLSALAYLSILLMDTGHLYAWGDLQNSWDVIGHFLRRDYGTFQLSGTSNGTFAGSCVAFGQTVGVFGIVAVVVALLGAMHAVRSTGERSTRAWAVVVVCFVLYIAVMFPSLGVGPVEVSASIVERFFVFPSLLLAVLAVTGARDVMPSLVPAVRIGLGVVVVIVAAVQVATADTPGLRHDTVIEEYARNLLISAKHPTKTALLVAYSDTQVYALRYIQATEPGFEKVFVVARGLMFQTAALDKLKASAPGLFDPRTERTADHRDLFDDFVLPNSKRFAVTHVLPYTSPTMHTTFLPLGRRVEEGAGNDVDLTAPRFSPASPVYRSEETSFVESKALFAEYAVFDLARAKQLAGAGDRVSAKKAAEEGLAHVPYCIPCMKNICALTDEAAAKEECNARAHEFEAQEFDYLQ